MQKEKNILLVSLENLNQGIQYKYYYNNDGGNPKYCNSILHAEVATKYVLSMVNIDEIVVIGSGATYDEGDEFKKTLLSTGDEFFVSDINKLSEYSLYRYRLSEFLEGLDLEEYEMLEDVTEEEKDILLKTFNKFYTELRARSKRKRRDVVFDILRKEPEFYSELIGMLPLELKSKEAWLKRYIYSTLTDSYKLRALESNEDVLMSFIPTTNNHAGSVDLENISKIIDALTGGEEETVNLYIDMQGLERTDDFTMVTVFSILKNEWQNKIHIKSILSTENDGFAGEIKNELERYEMNDLLAGINAFIQYGKVGSLCRYWEERNIYNEHIEKLLFAMQYIDDGVSLCNIADLEYGICELRKVLAEKQPEKEKDTLESNVLGVLEAGIRRDFGPLLEGEDTDSVDVLELIKWTYRKEFYQQTLTIIESRIPNDFVNRGILYYAKNEEDKAEALEVIVNEYNRTLPKDRYQFNDINHYFIKFYGRRLINNRQNPTKVQQDFAKMRADFTEQESEGVLKSYSLLADRDELEELIFAYSSLGGIRNQVSHGKSGLKKYPGQRTISKENENIRAVKEAVDYFIQQYGAAKEKLEGAEFTVVTIEGDEVREKSSRDKKKFYKNNKNESQPEQKEKSEEDKKE